LQRAVAAGERSLGAKFIAENQGHFWMLLETRPYMRALANLAEALRNQGIRLDAINVYEKMLKLNPNDNQGVRDPLLGLYLETDKLNDAALLLGKYKSDASAHFAWARVLERFLAGDVKGATIALTKARKANRHVELYLTAQKALPKEPPEMYSPGSEEEAALCLSSLSGAWAEHKQATLWLFDRLEEAGVGAVPSKAILKGIPAASGRAQ
jgi:tetratricopeptide (TPR) repeat protein